MKKQIINAALAVSTILACDQTKRLQTPDQKESYATIAEQKGWLENYQKGKEVLQKLSELGRDVENKRDMAAYRGEKLAFVGIPAPPGGTDDLITDGGFYLRVLSKDGKDLHPRAKLWEVIVCGTVLQVLPRNKLIVIGVDREDWLVLETW
jgi:hypothetical protein